jgi:DNA repair protein RadC
MSDISLPRRLYKFSVKREFDQTVNEDTTTDYQVNSPCSMQKALESLDLHMAEQENFVVFFLDTRLKIKGFDMLTKGLLDRSPCHPREVFRAAIINGCSKIAIAHNHPSGDSSPSSADMRITQILVDAGELLGIQVLDHCIIGSTHKGVDFHSMKAHGTMPKAK